jgi:hypothetical protein
LTSREVPSEMVKNKEVAEDTSARESQYRENTRHLETNSISMYTGSPQFT